MAYDHLLEFLPDGAVLTPTADRKKNAVLNVKVGKSQVAVKLTGDAERDEPYIIEQVWRIQARVEHQALVNAARREHQNRMRDLADQLKQDTQAKIKLAKDKREAKKIK